MGCVASLYFVNEGTAGGYKIPEQSSNAVALSAAYVASATGPDSAYYNPANMVWSKASAQIETSLNYITLPGVDFSGDVRFVGGLIAVPTNTHSKSESFLLPNIHYISPKKGKIRFGFSLVYPFGLSKRWDDRGPKAYAEEFTLETIETDLAIAYQVNEIFSMGGGIRGIYSEGKVQSDTTDILNPLRLTREMKGDDFSAGYFLAVSARPIQDFSMALTYRSKVTPELEGSAQLTGTGSSPYNGPASLEIVLPATLQIATAYTHRRAVFEFVYERTYWGAYQELDFQYAGSLTGSLASFDTPVEKNYKDSNTYRLGLSYSFRPEVTLMFGFGIDESPVPESTLNFELPDANARIYSTGFQYHATEKVTLALAYLLSQKKDRRLTNSNVSGKFESSAHVLNGSLVYIF